MGEHVRACLQAILDGKQMQLNLEKEVWTDMSAVAAIGWLGIPTLQSKVRIKPEPMCELGGVSFPMPLHDEPRCGDVVWAAYADGEAWSWTWDVARKSTVRNLFDAKILHATEDAATAHSQAMLAMNRQAVEKARQS